MSENKRDWEENGISTKLLEQSAKQLVRILGEPDRTYKDQVFRMLLKDRAIALEVYNAMNDTAYDNPNELTITTLENAVYLGMKNDVSFIIGSQLVLYEHQSTINPNMPLRNLFYVACVYSALTMNANIYGEKLVQVPEPRFVVFYNGRANLPERMKLRLSDAYFEKSDDVGMELTTEVININPGKNERLLAKSPTLHQYMKFVDLVRKYQAELSFAEALERAVDESIRTRILKDFLRRNRAEVLRMSIFEYDFEKHMQQEREYSLEKGELCQIIRLVVRKLQKNMEPEEIADILEEDVEKIQKICVIAKDFAPEYDVQKIYKRYEKENLIDILPKNC